MSSSCLIIGAGLAGLTAARRLQDAGWKVTVLDKGRAPGGRMATRQIGEAVFDHGAQFFTAREPAFQAAVQQWLAAGIAKLWFTSEEHSRYVGARGMSSIARYLATGLDVRCSEHVETVTEGWMAATRGGERYQADTLIVTAPVEQSLDMLRVPLPLGLRPTLQMVSYLPCFAVMAATTMPSLIPEPGYFRPESGELAWIADNQQKGISPVPAITLHATPEFTLAHWDAPRDEVGHRLIQAAGSWIAGDVVERQVHRWKYSNLSATLPERCVLAQAEQPVVFAGDAFGGPRVEGAFLSGLAAAEALLGL